MPGGGKKLPWSPVLLTNIVSTAPLPVGPVGPVLGRGPMFDLLHPGWRMNLDTTPQQTTHTCQSLPPRSQSPPFRLPLSAKTPSPLSVPLKCVSNSYPLWPSCTQPLPPCYLPAAPQRLCQSSMWTVSFLSLRCPESGGQKNWVQILPLPQLLFDFGQVTSLSDSL